MSPEDQVFDATTFIRNRQRMAEHRLQREFFDSVVAEAFRRKLPSHGHFTVDGTLIESLACIKSLQPIESGEDGTEDKGDGSPPSSGGRNVGVDFRGQRRSNKTRRSTSDPEARLYRKGQGNRALPCHSVHLLGENRNGLIAAAGVAKANGVSERETALEMLDHVRRRHQAGPKTLAADRGYDAGGFLLDLEHRETKPHAVVRSVAIKPKTDDAHARRRMRRRMKTKGYRMSQRRRKMIEEAFGWMRTVAGLRRARHVG